MPKLSKADLERKESETAARARNTSALASLNELKLAQLRAELVEVDQVKRDWAKAATGITAAILAAIPEISARMEGMDSRSRQAFMQKEFRKAFAAVGIENAIVDKVIDALCGDLPRTANPS